MAAKFPPFKIELNGVDTFPGHVYIPVEDESRKLQSLHEAIRGIDLFDDGEYEGSNYTPYVTVGKIVDTDRASLELKDYEGIHWGSVYIDSIHVVQDGTEKVGPFTTFDTIEQFNLQAEEGECLGAQP